jgi:hypothetical protein
MFFFNILDFLRYLFLEYFGMFFRYVFFYFLTNILGIFLTFALDSTYYCESSHYWGPHLVSWNIINWLEETVFSGIRFVCLLLGLALG